MSNMNIDFLVDKENKRVVVSNEKGTMKPREYQDNIKKILVKEDVVEELEFDLVSKKDAKKVYEQKTDDIDLKLKKIQKKSKSSKREFLASIVGIPMGVFFIFIASEWIVGNELALISIQQIITVLKYGVLVDLVISFFAILYVNSEDSSLSEIKRLGEDKKYIENLIQKLNLEIADLVQVITKNKAELQELIEQKEKNNIEMMSDEVQKISYRKELELERSYLTQLREENIIENKQEVDRKDSILGRFKKKKQY